MKPDIATSMKFKTCQALDDFYIGQYKPYRKLGNVLNILNMY